MENTDSYWYNRQKSNVKRLHKMRPAQTFCMPIKNPGSAAFVFLSQSLLPLREIFYGKRLHFFYVYYYYKFETVN